MLVLCVLIFPFAVLAELMKMNNGGGRGKGIGKEVIRDENIN